MTSRWKLPIAAITLTTAMTIAAGTVGEESKHPAMQDPSKIKDPAPATFTAKFETTKGDIVFDCTRDWAPHGVDRFYNLVKIGFFNEVVFFRVISGFMVQFGIHGNPNVSKHWSKSNLAVEAVKKSNTRGFLTYAQSGRAAKPGFTPPTRSTQLFINFGNNARLDKDGFAPICKVQKGMDVADKLYSKYGGKPSSKQATIQAEGNAYLKKAWPELDHIIKATIVNEGSKTDPGSVKGPKDAGGVSEPLTPEKSNTTTYIVIGLLAAGALLAFMFTQGNKEEEQPEPRPRKPRSTATRKRSKKKTASKKTGAATGTKKRRKKKKKKKASAGDE